MKVTAGDGDTVRDLQPVVVTRALGTAPHADAIWSVTLTPLGSTGNYAASGYLPGRAAARRQAYAPHEAV